jgi:hypothetical protein
VRMTRLASQPTIPPMINQIRKPIFALLMPRTAVC